MLLMLLFTRPLSIFVQKEVIVVVVKLSDKFTFTNFGSNDNLIQSLKSFESFRRLSGGSLIRSRIHGRTANLLGSQIRGRITSLISTLIGRSLIDGWIDSLDRCRIVSLLHSQLGTFVVSNGFRRTHSRYSSPVTSDFFAQNTQTKKLNNKV